MDKIKEKINKNWKFYITMIIAIILLLLLSFYSANLTDKLYNKTEMGESSDYIQDVNQGTEISQKFVAGYNNLEKIYINFEPFKDDKTIGGDILIGIKDSNGNVIKEENITKNYVREDNIYKFKFAKQAKSKDQEYELYIKFISLDSHQKFYSVKYNSGLSEDNMTTYVNGIKIDGNILTQQFYSNAKKSVFYYGLAFILAITTFIVSDYIHSKKNITEEKIFLCTVPIICMLFLLTMPTFKNHDELYHWFRSYEVSTGVLATKIDGENYGTKMPLSIAEIPTSDWTKITYSDVIKSLDIDLNKDGNGILYSETSAVYSFIQYIPQAIGIFIARIFTNKPLIMAYSGRLFNIIFSMTMLYIAIKIIPFGKKSILIASYIPIAIEGFSSLSPDAMTISVSILFIAYILYLTFGKKEKILLKDKILLLILSVAVALCKIVYIPLVGLMLIIPKEKFATNAKDNVNSNKKKILNIIVIAGIAIILNLIWLSFASRYLVNFRDNDSKYQILSILRNPLQYVQICLYTLNTNAQDYLRSMFGGDLGWGELVKINALIPYILCGLLTFTMFVDNSIKNKFKRYQKVIITIILLMICALIFTSLYVQWTTIGSTNILGIQGRYFIPILPLATILIGSIIKTTSNYDMNKLSKNIGIIGLTVQIFVILQIVVCHL